MIAAPLEKRPFKMLNIFGLRCEVGWRAEIPVLSPVFGSLNKRKKSVFFFLFGHKLIPQLRIIIQRRKTIHLA